MPELHLKQPGFTFSACRPFTKHCERIQKFRETGTLKHSYRNQLDKGCFAHDAAHSDSKDLDKKIISDKILKGRVYEIERNRKYDGYERTFKKIISDKILKVRVYEIAKNRKYDGYQRTYGL